MRENDRTEIGRRILNATQTELYLNMRFLSAALGNLDHAADLNTVSIGTDAEFIRYNPRFAMELFLHRPGELNRIYMHCLIHCLFCHMFYAQKYEDEDIWDLSCDIAAEYVIDSMDNPILYKVRLEERQGFYSLLSKSLRVLNAQQIYSFISAGGVTYDEAVSMQREFRVDDHSFWQRLKKDGHDEQLPNGIEMAPQTNLPLKEEWERMADRIRVEMEVSGSVHSDEYGKLSWLLKLNAARHAGFDDFLRRLMIMREEVGVDPDAFDLAYYNLGISLYGNMPLIEEVELVERKRIEAMVIVIDTSASTKRTMVQAFLEQTVAIIRKKEDFFNHIDLHIIECDNVVQKDISIKKPEEIEEYISAFSVEGGYGTDFRPVFKYIDDKIKQKEYPKIRGMMYFTDGYGDYPIKPPRYDVGFVFCRGADYDDTEVPDWAVKLYFEK